MLGIAGKWVCFESTKVISKKCSPSVQSSDCRLPCWQRNIPSVFYISTKAGVWFLVNISVLLIPSSRQSVLTRVQSNIDEGAFPTACGLHKKQYIQVMDTQNYLQNPQGVTQSHLCWRSLQWPLTSWKSRRRCLKDLRQSWGQTFSVHSFRLLWDRRCLGSLNICHTSIRCHASVVNSTHTLTLYCKQRNNVANNDMPEVLERWWSQQPASAEGWWWGCSWGHGSACEHHSHLSHKVGPVVDSTQLHSVVDVGRNLFIRCIMRFTTLRGQWSLP